ncbi:MAG TPA: hypothetical protein VFL79_06170 [Terriglobia bacterium]|nr:hypothetical protein [Terriglobia bacterium]
MFDYSFRSSRLILPVVLIAGLAMAKPANAEDPPQADLNWQSPARLHLGLRKERGTLVINGQGVEFRSEGKSSHSWPYIEIQTFDLAPHRFILTSYENRGKHLPGDRRFRFDFSADMTPGVAAELAHLVAKPVRNAEPDASRPAFDSIPARHTTRTGGTSGALRFHDGGIDYVTASKQDGRSWRWSDIQTLANPDAFHFRVGAYREIFEFELKQPMSSELFDRLWSELYTRDLNGLRLDGGLQR